MEVEVVVEVVEVVEGSGMDLTHDGEEVLVVVGVKVVVVVGEDLIVVGEVLVVVGEVLVVVGEILVV